MNTEDNKNYALMLQSVVDSFEEEKKKFPFLENIKTEALKTLEGNETVSKYKNQIIKANKEYHLINFLEVVEKWPKPRQLNLFTKFVADLKNLLLSVSGATPALPPAKEEEDAVEEK